MNKDKNTLYKLCSHNLGKPLPYNQHKIKVIFEVTPADKAEVRRHDVNTLYFSIINTLIPETQLEDLYKLRAFIRANDKTSDYTKIIENLVDTIANGNLNI